MFCIVCNMVLCIPGFGCLGVVFPFDLVKGFSNLSTNLVLWMCGCFYGCVVLILSIAIYFPYINCICI